MTGTRNASSQRRSGRQSRSETSLSSRSAGNTAGACYLRRDDLLTAAFAVLLGLVLARTAGLADLVVFDADLRRAAAALTTVFVLSTGFGRAATAFALSVVFFDAFPRAFPDEPAFGLAAEATVFG